MPSMEATINRPAGWVALSFALVLVLGGCSEKKSEAGASQESPAAQEQASIPEPAPQAAPPTGSSPEEAPARAELAAPEAAAQLEHPESSPAAAAPTSPALQAKAEPPRPDEAMPTPKVEAPPSPTATSKSAETTPVAPPEPAPTESKIAVAKDVLVLTGSPLGGVWFEHKLHIARAGNNCATCHHPSRPEKPASAPQQACSDCHTSAAAAPMKTKRQAAFHNPTAQSGTCIDCHRAESAKAKKPPLNCMDCHKKENK